MFQLVTTYKFLFQYLVLLRNDDRWHFVVQDSGWDVLDAVRFLTLHDIYFIQYCQIQESIAIRDQHKMMKQLQNMYYQPDY